MVSWKYDDNGEKKEYTTLLFQGDEDYINTLHIELIEGKEIIPNTTRQNNNVISRDNGEVTPARDPIGNLSQCENGNSRYR
jgi:hypothetical protein